MFETQEGGWGGLVPQLLALVAIAIWNLRGRQRGSDDLASLLRAVGSGLLLLLFIALLAAGSSLEGTQTSASAFTFMFIGWGAWFVATHTLLLIEAWRLLRRLLRMRRR